MTRLQIDTTLEKIAMTDLPDFVERIEGHYDYDNTGDPALFFTIHISSAPDSEFLKNAQAVKEKIRKDLEYMNVELWPYFTFYAGTQN